MSTLNARGREVFSGERRALPIHIGQRSPSIHERIRSMILAMKSAEREGYETFEDADDFDVGEDSPDKIEQLPNYQRYEYEKDFDHLVDADSDDSVRSQRKPEKQSESDGDSGTDGDSSKQPE